MFGSTIAEYVFRCSKASTLVDGNRAVRKAVDIDWYGAGCTKAKAIKCVDIMHNVSELPIKTDQSAYEFAKVYLPELQELLHALCPTEGSHTAHIELWDLAELSVMEKEEELRRYENSN